MSTVGDIIEAVKRLNAQDKRDLLERLSEIEFEDDWDRLITADANARKLDKFIEKAISEHRADRTTPFP